MHIGKAIFAIAALVVGLKVVRDRGHDAGGLSTETNRSTQPTWVLAYKQDEMSDEKTLQAKSSQWADGGGQFDITAECDEVRRTGIAFTIDYFAGNGQDAHYMLTSRNDVPMEIRLDNQASTSLSTGTNFNNEANIPFINSKANVGGGAADGLIFGLIAAFGSAGKPEELVVANMLRVRLPLTDGRNPILTVGLQDPDLQRFFAQCGFPGRNASQNRGSNTSNTGQSTTARYATIKSVQLNLRQGPSADYQPIARMSQGLRVRVLGRAETGWLQLETTDSGGSVLRGYANPDYLDLE